MVQKQNKVEREFCEGKGMKREDFSLLWDEYLEKPKLKKAYKEYADSMREANLGFIISIIEFLDKCFDKIF